MILRISIYVVAVLLLGAHFLRAGNLAMMALCIAAPLLFLWRRRWSLILLQFLACGAAGTWTVVGIQLVLSRQQSAQPWTAAAVILGVVAVYTLVAGLLLNSPNLAKRYPA